MSPGCLSHFVRARTRTELVVRRPARVSATEACTLPAVWVTAHEVLKRACVQQRAMVLQHAATGGVGLVAVEYMHWLAASVVATAGAQHHSSPNPNPNPSPDPNLSPNPIPTQNLKPDRHPNPSPNPDPDPDHDPDPEPNPNPKPKPRPNPPNRPREQALDPARPQRWDPLQLSRRLGVRLWGGPTARRPPGA